MSTVKQAYQVGESSVVIEIGDLVKSQADIIVSSDDSALSMRGGVSRSVRNMAGEEVYLEARKFVGSLVVGDIVMTGSGALEEVKYIFHGVTRCVGDRNERSLYDQFEIVENIARRCIRLAVELQLKSIAFPALGTGFASFSPQQVAATMARVIKGEILDDNLSIEVKIYLLPEQIAADVNYRHFFNEFDRISGMLDYVVRSHAVVMIHGIRDGGEWFERIADVLREEDHQIDPVILGYNYFDVLRFLVPIKPIRHGALKHLNQKLKSVLVSESIEKVSVVAHSFGCYNITQLLKQNKDIRLNKLIFCGAVVARNISLEDIKQQVDPIADPDYANRILVNDCGWLDIWPLLAESVTWGFGASGRFGFQAFEAADRHFPLRHGDYFKEEFVREYWVPFLSDGIVKKGHSNRPKTPWLLQMLTVFKLRYILILFAAIFIFYTYF